MPVDIFADMCSVENRNEVLVEGALVEVVEVFFVFVEVIRKIGADEAPVPGLEDVIRIVRRV